MVKLLSLDLATNVGACWLGERGTVPEFDTIKLEGDTNLKTGQFQVWLDDQYAVDPFAALAWERPLIMPTDTVDLLELLYGLVGVCRAFIGRQWILNKVAIPWREVDVPTVKRALTGKAKANKDEMLYAARRVMNWNVHSHHEADAAGVGVVAFSSIWPKLPTPERS